MSSVRGHLDAELVVSGIETCVARNPVSVVDLSPAVLETLQLEDDNEPPPDHGSRPWQTPSEKLSSRGSRRRRSVCHIGLGSTEPGATSTALCH